MAHRHVERVRGGAKRFRTAEIPLRASALAYHTFLAIVPAVGLAFWYLTAAGVTKPWREQVKGFFLYHLNVSSSPEFLKRFEQLTSGIGGKSMGLLSLAIFLYTTFSLVVKAGNSFDRVVGTRDMEPELHLGFFILLGQRLLCLTLLPLAVAVSVVVTSWLHQDSMLRLVFKLKGVGPLLATPLPWLVTVTAFFFVYRFMPSRPISSRSAFRAALVAGPAFELARLGMAIYSKNALSVHQLYGAMAAIPVFMIWMQLGWAILLCGALFLKTRGGNPAKAPVS